MFQESTAEKPWYVDRSTRQNQSQSVYQSLNKQNHGFNTIVINNKSELSNWKAYSFKNRQTRIWNRKHNLNWQVLRVTQALVEMAAWSHVDRVCSNRLYWRIRDFWSACNHWVHNLIDFRALAWTKNVRDSALRNSKILA